MIVEQDLDILAITESWMRGDITDQVTISELVPNGYLIKSIPRQSRGGGVAIIFKSYLQIKFKLNNKYLSFEHLEAETRVSSSSELLRFVIIYSPTPKTGNNRASELFIEEFVEFHDHLAMSSGNLLIVGDFN